MMKSIESSGQAQWLQTLQVLVIQMKCRVFLYTQHKTGFSFLHIKSPSYSGTRQPGFNAQL